MQRAKLYGYSDGSRFIGKSTEEIFREIEKENVWTEHESVSGIGSSTVQTKEILRLLPDVFSKFSIRSIFDIPCGDFNWFRHLDLTGINYFGGDIVESIVSRNKKVYASDNIDFFHFNLLSDKIGEYDLIFCRDCLVHFSFSDIFRTLENLSISKSKYFMTTIFPDEELNEDIPTGGWRPINLVKEPFNLPSPAFLLNEKCTEMDGVFSDKSLGLWRIEDIRK